METFLIICVLVVILIYMRTCNNKISNSLGQLEEEISLLQKRVVDLRQQITHGIIGKSSVSTETDKSKKETDKAAEWAKYMPSHSNKKEDEIIQVPVKEEVTPPEVIETPVVVNEVIQNDIQTPIVVEKEEGELLENIQAPTATNKELIPSPIIQTVQKEETITSSQLKSDIPKQPAATIVPPKVPAYKEEEDTKKDYEKYIGENLLSKIGIITLVLGVGYFVKYAIDQNWINEIGRVAIGILCGGAVIAVAHKLKDTYRTFSSILVGGGVSILYITVTIAFQDYHIFSQTIAFILAILITIFSVFLSIYYDRKELAIFSLLGGFGSPLMVSTGEGNYIVLFSYILILNAGMVILSFKKQWRIVNVIAYILTQGFLWTWLVLSFKDQFVGATCFAFLFYVQFYAVALIDHYKGNKEITAFQAFIILTNNLSLFAAGIYIFNDYPVDIRGIITIGVAALNAIPMLLLFKDKTVDKRMVYLLIAIVLTFVSLAVPIQLNGCAITMFWAAEAVILFWLWQKSEIKIFKTGFLLIELLVLISLVMDWYSYYLLNIDVLPVIFNKPFITGVVTTITVWINVWLFKKETDEEFYPGMEISSLRSAFAFAGTLLIFFTLFFELQYQMERFYEPQSFRFLIYGLYFYLFMGVVTIIRWNKIKWRSALYSSLIFITLFYITLYNHIVFQVRGSILFEELNSWGYFAMHYLALPSIILFFIFLIQKSTKVIKNDSSIQLIYWFVSLVSVVILSLEADNIILMLFYNGANQESLLHTSHNIIYPILWGISSFILMIIGMKKKNRTLRVISLALIVLIISKLYIYDIWKMEQTGRIIAFIFLGCLFLLVSFLYQKLKVLLIDKDAKTEENPEVEVEKQDEQFQ